MEENSGSEFHVRLKTEPVAIVTPPVGGVMEIGSSGRRERQEGEDW